MPKTRQYQCVRLPAVLASAMLLFTGTIASADEVFQARTQVSYLYQVDKK